LGHYRELERRELVIRDNAISRVTNAADSRASAPAAQRCDDFGNHSSAHFTFCARADGPGGGGGHGGYDGHCDEITCTRHFFEREKAKHVDRQLKTDVVILYEAAGRNGLGTDFEQAREDGRATGRPV
jgi:hypothetical protein